MAPATTIEALSGHLLLEAVYRAGLGVLPWLAVLSPALRAALRNGLTGLHLVLDDPTPTIAQFLASELSASSVRSVTVDGRLFHLRELLAAEAVEGLTLPQAVALAPLLRCSSCLKAVSAAGTRWLSVARARGVAADSCVAFQDFWVQPQRGVLGHTFVGGSTWTAATSSDVTDASVVLLDGLLEVDAPACERRVVGGLRRHEPRRGLPAAARGGVELQLPWGSSLCQSRASSWRLASQRYELRLGRSPVRSGGAGGGDGGEAWWLCFWFVVLLAFAVLLRCLEDDFARSTGHGGALLSHHPNKLLTFSQRLAYDLPALPPASSSCAAGGGTCRQAPYLEDL